MRPIQTHNCRVFRSSGQFGFTILSLWLAFALCFPDAAKAVWVTSWGSILSGGSGMSGDYWVAVTDPEWGESQANPIPRDDYQSPGGAYPNYMVDFLAAVYLGKITRWSGKYDMWENGQHHLYDYPDDFHSNSDSDHDGIPDDVDYELNDGTKAIELSTTMTFRIDGVEKFYANSNWITLDVAHQPVQYSNSWHTEKDDDGDSIPDDIDPFRLDPLNNTNPTQWGYGNTRIVDGQYCRFIGRDPAGLPLWSSDPGAPEAIEYVTISDSDSDTIPDNIDPYPEDATNNSFMFAGGLATVPFETQSGGVTTTRMLLHAFLAKPYPGSPTYNCGIVCTNGNQLPDAALNEVLVQGVILHWDGTGSSSILVDGEMRTYPACDYLSSHIASFVLDDNEARIAYYDTYGNYVLPRGTLLDGSPDFSIDSDSDKLPDEIDPYCNDKYNHSFYQWSGGDFWIDGYLHHYLNQDYPGIPGSEVIDSDGDHIPDANDTGFVDDAQNGNYWFAGGTFRINGMLQSVPARQVAAGYTTVGNQQVRDYFSFIDQDGDGIPDSIDPYRCEFTNNNFWYFGAEVLVDGVVTTLGPQWVKGTNDPSNWNNTSPPSAFADDDHDGIPDTVDPAPDDYFNGNFWFPGGNFWIDGLLTPVEAAWVKGKKPYAYGVYARPNGPAVWVFGPPGFVDADGDGIPDALDKYMLDPNNFENGIVTFQWNGGTFMVDGKIVVFPNKRYVGATFVDPDNDGIPNGADIYPGDMFNNSAHWQVASCYWNGQWLPNGLNGWHRADATSDADNDHIPDDVDNYPADFYNNTNFTWPESETTFYFNNVPHLFEPTVYQGIFADRDGDSVPDVADLLPDDYWNDNDTDGDGIPDVAEANSSGLLDYTNPGDAQNLRADGLTYLQAYQNGVALDQLLDPAQDSDGDSMPDLFEIYYGLNRNNAADAYDSPDGDLLFNVEKCHFGLMVGYRYFYDGWNNGGYEYYATFPSFPNPDDDPSVEWVGSGHTYEAIVPYRNNAIGVAESDWDNDGVSNIDEMTIFRSDPRTANAWRTNLTYRTLLLNQLIAGHCSVTTHVNYNDLVQMIDAARDDDNDGLTNGEEATLGFNRNSATTHGIADSLYDRDGDGIPDIVELRLGLNYMQYGVGDDTDGDSVSDVDEVENGTDPNDIESYINAQSTGLVLFTRLR